MLAAKARPVDPGILDRPGRVFLVRVLNSPSHRHTALPRPKLASGWKGTTWERNARGGHRSDRPDPAPVPEPGPLAGGGRYLPPIGRMDSNNAAKYVNRAPKTLAMWRRQGIGPGWTKVGGRIFYKKEDLDRFLSGVEAA